MLSETLMLESIGARKTNNTNVLLFLCKCPSPEAGQTEASGVQVSEWAPHIVCLGAGLSWGLTLGAWGM